MKAGKIFKFCTLFLLLLHLQQFLLMLIKKGRG